MNQARRHPKHTDVIYKVERDEQDEGTFVLAYSKTQKLDDGCRYQIAHLHVPDENVRHNRWSAGDVQVDEEFRRRGIATQMYQIMAQELGSAPTPSGFKSPDAKALWASGKLSVIKFDRSRARRTSFANDIAIAQHDQTAQGRLMSASLCVS